eukprot:g760.t1
MAESSTLDEASVLRESLTAKESPRTKNLNVELAVSVKDKDQDRDLMHMEMSNSHSRRPVLESQKSAEAKASLTSVKSNELLAEVEGSAQVWSNKDRAAVGLFVLVLFASCVLSIVALTCRSEGWITSDSIESLKIGWRRGCLGEKGDEPSTCNARGSFGNIENILSKEPSVYGRIAVAFMVVAWVLPLIVFLLVNRFQRNGRETCCHGYTISILWSLCGITLLVMGVLFILSSQAAADETKERRLDVYCKGFRVCTKVVDVDKCIDVTCRVTARGVVQCADHGRCQTREVHLNCEDEGVVCDLVPDWGLYCLLISASLMVVLGVALGLGSIFIGLDL